MTQRQLETAALVALGVACVVSVGLLVLIVNAVVP